jgi:hypothetical protein
MQIPGHETQMWGNAINEIALQQMHEKEDFFVGSSGVNEFDEILKLLLDANSILSTMITANNVASVEFSLPGSITDWFEFNDLYKQWQASRKKTSSIAGDITRNPFYFRIVGMGPRALPFIFSHLQNETELREPNHWFPALNAITGVDPVPTENRGNIRQMAGAWLEWGRQEGYLYAEGVGKRVSKSR